MVYYTDDKDDVKFPQHGKGVQMLGNHTRGEMSTRHSLISIFSTYCHAQSSSGPISNIVMNECLLNKRI